jgi:hypothetical protein
MAVVQDKTPAWLLDPISNWPITCRCGGGHRRQLDVVDAGNGRVLKLEAGSSTPTELPFTDLNLPCDAAVDTAGAVYVASAAFTGPGAPEGKNR